MCALKRSFHYCKGQQFSLQRKRFDPLRALLFLPKILFSRNCMLHELIQVFHLHVNQLFIAS